jgi:CRISPR type II-A-associated protein Csn2
MDQLSKENLYKEQVDFNAHIIDFLQKICDLTPYHLSFTQEFFSLDIIKLANVKIETEEMTMLENLVNYIGLLGELGVRDAFVFVNLKSYLPDRDIERLYEYAGYHKIRMLLIENVERSRLKTENVTVIDVDKCIF